MDLSTAVNAMSGGATTVASSGSNGSSNGNSSIGGGGGGGGAVACPVCTLYLREGISLQKHLDTHPKEQVIEALIRASSGTGSGAAALLAASQTSSTPLVPQTLVTPQPQLSMPPTVASSQPQQPQPSPPQPPPQQHATATSGPHVPHAQSPYPIGPIFECPPQINAAMIPTPQFASFSYQQFVNNGTMMIPTQYAMAQTQAPAASQMMQMLYSPFGMYHQQQIPTLQMISTPPLLPTSTTALPTTVPAATTRIRPIAPASTSNAASVIETLSSSLPSASSAASSSTTTSLPTPSTPTIETTEMSPQAQPSSLAPMSPVLQQEPQQQQLVIDVSKESIEEKIIPGPDRILPDLEMPMSPEPTDIEKEEEQISSAHVQDKESAQDGCILEGPNHVEQYQRENSDTLIINRCDDKTESILPDIDDNQEIESLIVRKPNKDSQKNTQMEVIESVENTETAVSEEVAEKEFVENIECNEGDSCKELENKLEDNNVQIVDESIKEPKSTVDTARISGTDKPEFEQINRLLNNVGTELSNIELSNKENEEKPMEEDQEIVPSSFLRKQTDEDETTDTSYHKTCLEPTECKIIVAHEETDVSSIASSNSVKCNMEIQKVITSTYQYKYSQSAPTSPVSKKKFNRSLSRASLRSDFDRSNENICTYPVGFEATTLQDFLKDNYNDEDMELEEPHHSYLKQNDGIVERVSSHTTLSTSVSSSCVSKPRCSNVPASPVSVRSTSSYCQIEEEEEEEEDSDVESCDSGQSNDKDDDEEEDEEDDHIMLEEPSQQVIENNEKEDKKNIKHHETVRTSDIMQQLQQQHATDLRSQNLMVDHYSSSQFPLNHHTAAIHQQQHQQQSVMSMQHETYPLSNSGTSQNLLNITECVDPTTSTDSKSYSSSTNKSIVQKPSTELLNISEDAHAGPINVFEFDGLQILVPSTFISESSQKAVSGTSQQSMSSSENGAGNDEEVKSVNMRADETMPARGELSEQESNGCTEQSAWQLYMGQESSRMSTSYDLMARESWEESEGSEHEDNNGGPLLDSRSLATHFTSSLFLDRDRKTPTRRIFKCPHCPEVFECPKERRVHSTMVHKEAGPSNSNDAADPSELKDIKLLEGRANVFEELFVPSGLHMQQAYQHHQQQSPLLHQLQPPQQRPSSTKAEADSKVDVLHMSAVTEVTCNLCNQRFSSEKSLQIHHRRMHVAETVKRVRENAKCQICNEEFTSVANFNLHLKIHPLECGQCGKYFYRKQNFKLHMKRHLGIKPFPCNLCGKAFLTKQKLDEHTNGHTGNAPVKCNLCNETFRRYSNLTQHKNRHHLNIKKKLKDFICHCGEVFHTKKKLAWHKETHDEKPKACTYCNERFIHMASLTRHMRRAHNRRFVPDAQRENENVECPICKCIYLRSSLAVHMRVHNGERPYECQVCSKTFSTKWNLQLHKWTHAARSTKPFKCNQCSAAFYRHSDYTAHMNSHRNVRPYTCNYCGAQFIRKYNCLRHVKEHEENKQYTCDICNKTFHRSYYLKEHLRVHSGARPYTCHICGKSSSTKSNHNKHVRIHHAREPVNTEN